MFTLPTPRSQRKHRHDPPPPSSPPPVPSRSQKSSASSSSSSHPYVPARPSPLSQTNTNKDHSPPPPPESALLERVSSVKALGESAFGDLPVVQYGPSIHGYLTRAAFAFAGDDESLSRLEGCTHPAILLPLRILYRIFGYLTIRDLFAFSHVDWASKDRIDEYLLYSSLVLGASTSHGFTDTLYFPPPEGSLSFSSSASDTSSLSSLSLPPSSYHARRRFSLGSPQPPLPLQQQVAGSTPSPRKNSVSGTALAMNAMRGEIQKYQSQVAKLESKLKKRKTQLAKVKAITLSSNAKTVKVMQQLANKNDNLRTALAEERALSTHLGDQLMDAQNELARLKSTHQESSHALASQASQNESLSHRMGTLEASLAHVRDSLSQARSALSIAERERDKAVSRVEYLETLGFAARAEESTDLLQRMQDQVTTLRDDNQGLRSAMRNLNIRFQAQHLALARTLALLAPSFKHSNVLVTDLKTDILDPLSQMQDSEGMTTTDSSAATNPAPSSLFVPRVVEAGDGANEQHSDTDRASIAYLSSSHRADGRRISSSGSSFPDLSELRAQAQAGLVSSSPLDAHLFSIVQRMVRARARDKLILFCAQYMGKRHVPDPLRWGAAVRIQTWWRAIVSSWVLGESRELSASTESAGGAPLVVVRKRTSSKLDVPAVLSYWHDRYTPKVVEVKVEASNLDLLIRRMTAPDNADDDVLGVVLTSYPAFLDSEVLLQLLVKRFFSLPRDSGDLPFFLSAVQPLIQTQVVTVLLRWLLAYPEDFAPLSMCSGLTRFLDRTLPVTRNKTLLALLNLVSRILRAVASRVSPVHGRLDVVPHTGLGLHLKSGSVILTPDVSVVASSAADWADAAEDKTERDEGGVEEGALPNPRAPPVRILDTGLIFSVVQTDPVEVARQLALRDFAVFARIKRTELLRQAFVKPAPEVDAPNVSQLIVQFNETSTWAMTQVLMGTTAEERAGVICVLIDVARECGKLGNYSALMAIVSGLQGAAVSRLKHTWPLLPEDYEEMWSDLVGSMSMNHNYHAYRESLRRRSAPAVPYLGVFCQDLVFIDDGNASLVPPHHLVNLSKHTMSADVINGLLRLQTCGYDFHPVDAIQTFLVRSRHVTEDMLFARSLDLEPRGMKPVKHRPVAYTRREAIVPSTLPLDHGQDIWDDLARFTSLVTFDEGQVIVKEGQSSRHLLVVAHGIIQVHLPTGHSVLLGDGQVVGEMAIFLGHKRSATVSAVTRVTLLELPSKNLGILLKRHPALETELNALAKARAQLNRDLAASFSGSASDLSPEGRLLSTPPGSVPKWFTRISRSSSFRWARARVSNVSVASDSGSTSTGMGPAAGAGTGAGTGAALVASTSDTQAHPRKKMRRSRSHRATFDG